MTSIPETRPARRDWLPARWVGTTRLVLNGLVDVAPFLGHEAGAAVGFIVSRTSRGPVRLNLPDGRHAALAYYATH